jgi:hypothetical protein
MRNATRVTPTGSSPEPVLFFGKAPLRGQQPAGSEGFKSSVFGDLTILGRIGCIQQLNLQSISAAFQDDPAAASAGDAETAETVAELRAYPTTAGSVAGASARLAVSGRR